MGAAERRMAILEALCSRHYDTVENLMFEFNVSERTIRYDIQALSLAYPIYTVRGNKGGVYLMNGFKFNRTYLTVKQMTLLKKLEITLIGEEKEIMRSILIAFTAPDLR